MGPVNCEIILDKPSKVYSAGERIQGKVVISLRTATKISTIHLHLIGKASFGLFGQDNFKFFADTKSIEVKKILPSGTHKFPIVWTLPSDLLSSFTWKSGSVTYLFLMEIKDCQSSGNSVTKFTIDLVQATAFLEIQNVLNLNHLPLDYQRTRGYNASYVRNSERDRDSVGDAGMVSMALDFIIDRQCYIPGEFIKFTCSINYENPNRQRRFPGVKVALNQEDTYFRNGSVTTSVIKIWLKTGPKIRPNNTTIWEGQIQVPVYCQSTPIDSCGVLSVQYYLNVTAALWNTTDKPQFRIPLIIGMIPLNQSSLPMIPNHQRPSLTVLHGNNNENILEDFDFEVQDEEDSPVHFRPETPPPSYEAAVLESITEIAEAEESPPPYSILLRI